MAHADAIVDVAGVQVGHHQRLEDHWATGVTVVLVPDGATGAVDVRGGGPGTRETDALHPSRLVQHVQAIVLSGGSAYGLASADGVMRWLGERGFGFPVGEPGHVVPIVPGAVLFDLPMNAWGNRPDADFGYMACESASRGETRQGNVGAGTGAVVGGVKGGIGTASAVLDDGTTVGALMAVNSSGSVINPETGLPWVETAGLRAPDPREVQAGRARIAQRSGRLLNTTIGVVATDLALSKAECQRIAVAAQDGLARAVRPAHALVDGDTIFALATGAGEWPPSDLAAWVRRLDEVCAVAADVVARAIVRAVLAAEPVGKVTSYTELYPSARE